MVDLLTNEGVVITSLPKSDPLARLRRRSTQLAQDPRTQARESRGAYTHGMILALTAGAVFHVALALFCARLLWHASDE